MENTTSFDFAFFKGLLVCHLLSLKNKSNLVNLDSFFLLKSLLHLEHSVRRVEGEVLSSSSKGLQKSHNQVSITSFHSYVLASFSSQKEHLP